MTTIKAETTVTLEMDDELINGEFCYRLVFQGIRMIDLYWPHDNTEGAAVAEALDAHLAKLKASKFSLDEGIDASTGKLRKMEVWEAREDNGEIVRLTRFVIGVFGYGRPGQFISGADFMDGGTRSLFDTRCIAFRTECLRAEAEARDAERALGDCHDYSAKLIGGAE
jgi:hypothetical protein